RMGEGGDARIGPEPAYRASHDPRRTPMAELSGKQGERVVVDDLNVLMAVLPPQIREPLDRHALRPDLLEVVLDLGREPAARFPGREMILSHEPVSEENLD